MDLICCSLFIPFDQCCFGSFTVKQWCKGWNETGFTCLNWWVCWGFCEVSSYTWSWNWKLMIQIIKWKNITFKQCCKPHLATLKRRFVGLIIVRKRVYKETTLLFLDVCDCICHPLTGMQQVGELKSSRRPSTMSGSTCLGVCALVDHSVHSQFCCRYLTSWNWNSNLDSQFFLFWKGILLGEVNNSVYKVLYFFAHKSSIFITWQTIRFSNWVLLSKEEDWIQTYILYFSKAVYFKVKNTDGNMILIPCFVQVMDCNKLEIRVFRVCFFCYPLSCHLNSTLHWCLV